MLSVYIHIHKIRSKHITLTPGRLELSDLKDKDFGQVGNLQPASVTYGFSACSCHSVSWQLNFHCEKNKPWYKRTGIKSPDVLRERKMNTMIPESAFPTELGIEGALTWALHVAEGIESNSHGLTLQAFTVVNIK